MNLFFDVDNTIVDVDGGLRPGVREAFDHLTAAGHRIYLWSGLGPRREVVKRHDLGAWVVDCYDKPLHQHERMLEPLGIEARPEFVVDDHPHLVHAFGGMVVTAYVEPDLEDAEMSRVVDRIDRLETGAGAPAAQSRRTNSR